jgi:L-threonylcarbamoyladenylate synthase
MLLSKNTPQTLETVARCLRDNRVVIIPCDTVYGFVGRAPETDAAIRAIKGRDEVKPFISFIEKPADIERFGAIAPDPAVLALWPGPLTLILAQRSGSTVERPGTTVALRCPDDPWLQNLLKLCGFPLFTTSVNRSGQPLLSQVSDMAREFESEVACIVDAGDLPGALPSTLLDVSQKPYRVLRQGSLKVPDSLLA